MINPERIYVVIAAYNEGQVIAGNIANLRNIISNIVVVDDCSSDDTSNQAMQAKAHVLRHPINLGQGAALQTGIEFALAQGAEYIVTFDADGQHQPNEILPMVEALVHRSLLGVGFSAAPSICPASAAFY